MPPRIPKDQLFRARRMRREPAVAEEILWRTLRNRAIKAKFRRQVPIGPYVVDFACVAAKVVVEADGPRHETAEQQATDEGRDAWLRRHGWRVVRIPNVVTLGSADIAVARICDFLAAARPSSDPR